MRGVILKGRVDSRARGQAIGVQIQVQGMREEAGFRMFFEKSRPSKQKLEIDDP